MTSSPGTPPSRRRRVPGQLAGTLIAIGVVLLLSLVARSGTGGNGQGGLGVGRCVRHQPKYGVKVASCSSPEAYARITTLVHDGVFSVDQLYGKCPADSDSAASDVFNNQTVCLRNLRLPHPGDPGAGGGLLVAGDCIDAPASGLGPVTEVNQGVGTGFGGAERPCSSSKAYASVLARAPSTSACPANALEAVRLSAQINPTVCVAGDHQVLQPRDCMSSPRQSFGAAVKTPCSPRSQAYARVLARVPTAAACPAGTRARMTDAIARPSLALLCLGPP